MWSFGLLFLASLIVSIVFFVLAIKKNDRSKKLMKGITFLAISYTLWLFVADISDSNFFHNIFFLDHRNGIDLYIFITIVWKNEF